MKRAGKALMCASRHPGLVIVLFCLRLVFAVAGAVSWSSAFAPNWILSLPRRDAGLFQPGLQLPFRLFAENPQEWWQRLRASGWLALAFIIVSAIVVALVLQTMYRQVHPRRDRHARPTFDNIGCQVVTVVVSWALVLLAIYLAQQFASILPPLTYQLVGEKGADLALVMVALLLVLAIVLIRIWCDLTRAGLSRSRRRLTTIALAAADDLRTRWGFWVAGYVCFMLPTVALPLVVAAWFPCLGKGAPNHVLEAFFAHQGVVVISCGLQLGWLALTLLHGPAPSRPEGTERSPQSGH